MTTNDTDATSILNGVLALAVRLDSVPQTPARIWNLSSAFTYTVDSDNVAHVGVTAGGGLSAIADQRILGNFSGASAVPTAQTAAATWTFLGRAAFSKLPTAGAAGFIGATAPGDYSHRTIAETRDALFTFANGSGLDVSAGAVSIDLTDTGKFTSLGIALRAVVLNASQHVIAQGLTNTGGAAGLFISAGQTTISSDGTGFVAFSGERLSSVGDPIAAQDAVTMSWAESHGAAIVREDTVSTDGTAAWVQAGEDIELPAGASSTSYVQLRIQVTFPEFQTGAGEGTAVADPRTLCTTVHAAVTRDSAGVVTVAYKDATAQSDGYWSVISSQTGLGVVGDAGVLVRLVDSGTGFGVELQRANTNPANLADIDYSVQIGVVFLDSLDDGDNEHADWEVEFLALDGEASGGGLTNPQATTSQVFNDSGTWTVNAAAAARTLAPTNTIGVSSTGVRVEVLASSTVCRLNGYDSGGTHSGKIEFNGGACYFLSPAGSTGVTVTASICAVDATAQILLRAPLVHVGSTAGDDVKIGNATGDIGEFGSAGTGKPTITGNVTTGTLADLQSVVGQLLTYFANRGTITNSTT